MTALLSKATESFDLGGRGPGFVTHTMTIQVRASEVPAPEKGDVITVEGREYRVKGLSHRDTLELVWTLEI